MSRRQIYTQKGSALLPAEEELLFQQTMKDEWNRYSLRGYRGTFGQNTIGFQWVKYILSFEFNYFFTNFVQVHKYKFKDKKGLGPAVILRVKVVKTARPNKMKVGPIWLNCKTGPKSVRTALFPFCPELTLA